MADTSVAFLLPGWAGSVELILNNKKFIVYIHNVHAVIFVLTNTKKKPRTMSESKYILTYCQIWENKLLLFWVLLPFWSLKTCTINGKMLNSLSVTKQKHIIHKIPIASDNFLAVFLNNMIFACGEYISMLTLLIPWSEAWDGLSTLAMDYCSTAFSGSDSSLARPLLTVLTPD